MSSGMLPGSSPVATGRSREEDQADQDPGYNAPSRPARAKPNTVLEAVTPDPQEAVTAEPAVTPCFAKCCRRACAERNLPVSSVSCAAGDEMAVGMWPATESNGSVAPV